VRRVKLSQAVDDLRLNRIRRKKLLLVACLLGVFGYLGIADIEAWSMKRRLQFVAEPYRKVIAGIENFERIPSEASGSELYSYVFATDSELSATELRSKIEHEMRSEVQVWKSPKIDQHVIGSLRYQNTPGQFSLVQIIIERPVRWYDWQEIFR
jgi:hypothetical protein